MVEKDKLNQMTRQLAKVLGWKAMQGHRRTLYAVNYPYAIHVGKSRKMILVRGVLHPAIEKIMTPRQYKKAFIDGTSVDEIAKRIKEKMLPKYMAHIDELTKEIVQQRRKDARNP